MGQVREIGRAGGDEGVDICAVEGGPTYDADEVEETELCLLLLIDWTSKRGKRLPAHLLCQFSSDLSGI